MAAQKKTDLEAVYEAIEKEIERRDAGGDALEDTEPVDEPIVFTKRPLDVIVRVRLSGEQYSKLDALADERGIGPGELLRKWALQHLNKDTVKS